MVAGKTATRFDPILTESLAEYFVEKMLRTRQITSVE